MCQVPLVGSEMLSLMIYLGNILTAKRFRLPVTHASSWSEAIGDSCSVVKNYHHHDLARALFILFTVKLSVTRAPSWKTPQVGMLHRNWASPTTEYSRCECQTKTNTWKVESDRNYRERNGLKEIKIKQAPLVRSCRNFFIKVFVTKLFADTIFLEAKLNHFKQNRNAIRCSHACQ